MYRGSEAHKAYLAAWMKEYRVRAKDKIAAQRKLSRGSRSDEVKKISREYYAANSERMALKRQKRYRENPELLKLHAKARRNRKKHHKPSWMPWSDLRAAYKLCPQGLVVDHVVPLVGKINGIHIISGLHVPWNLQFITAFDNGSKGCCVDIEAEELRLMRIGNVSPPIVMGLLTEARN